MYNKVQLLPANSLNCGIFKKQLKVWLLVTVLQQLKLELSEKTQQA